MDLKNTQEKTKNPIIVDNFSDCDIVEVINPYGFIYVITNMINGKRYIGQKKFDNASRWVSYMGGGKHLRVAQEKYGVENFKRDIIKICYSMEETNESEYEIIKSLNAVESDSYYNVIDGGDVKKLLCVPNEEHMIPIFSICDRLTFESFYEACDFYNISTSYIKNSFKYNGCFGNKGVRKRKLPIFRKLCELRKGQTFCSVCGCIYNKNSPNSKVCEFCSDFYYGNKKDKNFYDSMVVNRKLTPNIESVELYLKNKKDKVVKIKNTKRCSKCGEKIVTK